MIDVPGVFAVVGMVSISAALMLMGQLSRRLGRVTRSGPHYYGFYLSALLVMMGAIARSFHLTTTNDTKAVLHEHVLWVLLYNGAPALGVTVAVIVAWRYWSWLLAERGW